VPNTKSNHMSSQDSLGTFCSNALQKLGFHPPSSRVSKRLGAFFQLYLMSPIDDHEFRYKHLVNILEIL
jgi:hypothetical protein